MPECINGHPANNDNECNNLTCTYRVSARHKAVGEDDTREESQDDE